jgi:uncharacterized protein
MLLRFGTSNHRSIRDYQELLFVASSLKDSQDGLLDPSPLSSDVSDKSIKVIPVLGIYGSNAAGKSTMLNALDFFINAIVLSQVRGRPSGGTPFAPFVLDKESQGKPSRYDVDIALGGVRYHYGFELNGKHIVSEWLYSYPIGGKRVTRTVLFHRDANLEEPFYFGKTLKGENKQIVKLVRPNSLFLSAAAQNAHPALTELFNFVSQKITTRFGGESMGHSLAAQLLAYFGDDKTRRDDALRFLAAADIGVVDIDFSKVSVGEKTKGLLHDFEQLMSKHFEGEELPSELIEKERLQIKLLHRGKDALSYPINLGAESAGTISLLQLIGPVFGRLREGGVLIVDELNSTLHPLVSRELIKLFSSNSTNPGGAQLLFTTHDTNLLTGGLLRRDQIWFAEKDNEGGTHLYPLSKIAVRAEDNLEKGYLTGRFGSIPFLGADNLVSPTVISQD